MSAKICIVFNSFLMSFHSGQHWLQHQAGHPEEHSTAHKELFRRSPDESLQPDEKGLLPQVPPLWHLSAYHQEERPRGHHVSQKVTLLRVQRARRGHDWTFGLVTLCICAGVRARSVILIVVEEIIHDLQHRGWNVLLQGVLFLL